jgi:hypothetical protein
MLGRLCLTILLISLAYIVLISLLCMNRSWDNLPTALKIEKNVEYLKFVLVDFAERQEKELYDEYRPTVLLVRNIPCSKSLEDYERLGYVTFGSCCATNSANSFRLLAKKGVIQSGVGSNGDAECFLDYSIVSWKRAASLQLLLIQSDRLGSSINAWKNQADGYSISYMNFQGQGSRKPLLFSKDAVYSLDMSPNEFLLYRQGGLDAPIILSHSIDLNKGLVYLEFDFPISTNHSHQPFF